MTSMTRTIGWMLVGLLGCTAAQAAPPTILHTGYVFPGFALADAAAEVQVSAVDLSLPGGLATGQQGTLVFRDCPLSCNAFGDLTPEGVVRESRHTVAMEQVEVLDRERWGRKVFALRFEGGRFPNRFYLVTSGHPALPAKLMVLAEGSEPIMPQGEIGQYEAPPTYDSAYLLPLFPAEPPPAEFDVPLSSILLSSRPYWTDRLPLYRVARADISGVPGSDGGIVLDGNGFSLEAFGEGGMATLLAFRSRPVHFKELPLTDPLGKGRRLFRLEPLGDGPPSHGGLLFTLVVAPTCLEPHRLIIRRDEELLCILPLADREYVRHLRLLQGLSEERERAAVQRIYEKFRGRTDLYCDKQHLTHFGLRVRGLAPGDLDPLLDLPHVFSLSLNSEEPLTAEALAVLPRLPRLVYLGLQGPAVPSEILEQLPRLRTLGIEGHERSPMPPPPVVLPSRALAAIGKMNALTELSLTGLELEPDSLRPLTSLRALKSLRIPNTRVRLVSLLELNRALPELETETRGCHLNPASHTVQLAGVGTTDADVAAVAALPWLQVLNLDSCENITDAAAAKISEAENLVELRLVHAKPVTDQGIHGWSRLTKLRHLTLSCPQLTDRAVDELIALEGLEQVELYGQGVTREGLDFLRQELPMCKVLPE